MSSLVASKELAEVGKVTPVIERLYSLSETYQALGMWERGTPEESLITMWHPARAKLAECRARSTHRSGLARGSLAGRARVGARATHRDRPAGDRIT